MIRTCFNEGWLFGKGSGSALAAAFGGGNQEMSVTLPHDAAILEMRDVRELFSDMGILNPQENADQFYAVMFFSTACMMVQITKKW